MNTTAQALPRKTLLPSLTSLLPLIASQGYVIWLVATGALGYMQVLLITAAELSLVLLLSAMFFSPTRQILAKRMIQWFFTSLALFVGSFAAVSHDVHPGTREQPLFRMIDVFKNILTADVFKDGLVYIGITLGLSLVMAWASRAARRYWFNSIVQPFRATLLGMIVISFVAPLLADPKGATLSSAVAIVCILSGVRILATWVTAYISGSEEKDAEFQRFTAADA
jgi:hypothetical protein